MHFPRPHPAARRKSTPEVISSVAQKSIDLGSPAATMRSESHPAAIRPMALLIPMIETLPILRIMRTVHPRTNVERLRGGVFDCIRGIDTHVPMLPVRGAGPTTSCLPLSRLRLRHQNYTEVLVHVCSSTGQYGVRFSHQQVARDHVQRLSQGSYVVDDDQPRSRAAEEAQEQDPEPHILLEDRVQVREKERSASSTRVHKPVVCATRRSKRFAAVKKGLKPALHL